MITAVLAAGAAVVATAAPAAADGTQTLLEGVTAARDVATAGGKVFVAAVDRIVVADSTGAVTGSIGSLPGAVGFVASPDGSRLYVALRDSSEVAVLDTTTLAEVRRIPLGAPVVCPYNLALDGNQLWVGYGCGQWGGGVATVDVTAPSPEVVAVWTDAYGAPVVSVAGGVLAAGETGLSPASLRIYDVAGSTATLRGTIPNDGSYVASNLQDLVLTNDGHTVITAAGWPYSHVAYDTTTFAEVRRYGEGIGYYPNSATISPDGTFLAAGRGYSTVLSVHRVDNGATLSTADPTSGDLVAGSLAFNGPDVFGLLYDFSYQRFYLWRVAGATLLSSAISLTPPAAATALEPLTIEGRLTLSDGQTPGAQTLSVRRTLPDGSTAALPAVTTAADGTFSVTDRPPVSGSLLYTVSWAGDATYRGSTVSVAVQVAKRAASLTLTGPTTGEAGKRIRLSGTLQLDGSPPSPAATLQVSRTTYNNWRTATEQLADVTTDSHGAFRISDTPRDGGRLVYTVTWDGNDVYTTASASHEVAVSSRTARVTAVMQQPAYAIEPYTVAGGISYQVGDCSGLKTISVTRQIAGGPIEERPAVTTDASCTFRFEDTVATPASVRYTFSWAGDAGHDAASTTISGTVQQQPSYIQATAADDYLTINQRPDISGIVAGSRTGPLGTALTLVVTRTNPDGSAVRLRDVSTAADGTFRFRDSLPRVDPLTYPAFTYEISWAGTVVYAPSSTTVTVYVTPTG